ncbi:hypothetical protein WICMUC_005312 [Wickerhamomyces mucosus]|uniref:Uncharacterized protein n=1 Tax=Wickerhamomyces mucosus TaxID=1378264 RepID=A0A9P8PA35_9ASCO|nr:hypothetical protein WICMUC_005312 [Wickerhamomyces mucosus]
MINEPRPKAEPNSKADGVDGPILFDLVKRDPEELCLINDCGCELIHGVSNNREDCSNAGSGVWEYS